MLTDGTRIPFDVTNGSSIATIEKTATVGLVDTYTITLTNGDTFEFEVTNADGSTAGTVGYDNTDSGLDATNVQDAIDEVNDNKANKTDLTSINQTGTTNTTGSTIASGTYFYLNRVLVKAKTTIASGATFTLNTNYEVVTAGGLNAIENFLKTVDIGNSITHNTSAISTVYAKSAKITGNMVVLYFVISLKSSLNEGDELFDLGSFQCNESCAPILMNNGTFKGLAVVGNNKIAIINPITGSATCRFVIVTTLK